jgi:iron complex outermembrane receptor protein
MAFAQDAAKPAEQPATPQDRGAAADASTNQNATLGEVVVTATRRKERLSDVPMAVTALSSQDLDRSGVTDTGQLYKVTPGLQLPYYGAFLSPSIRGVSANNPGPGLTSNIGFYVDGVYQPEELAQLMELPDVQQIQVLKGPQGALYGENATGGAIVITTLTPQFHPEGTASVSYGNYDDEVIRGFVTGPLSNTLAGSISTYYEHREGFLTNAVTGEREKGVNARLVRGKLLFKPSDAVSITLTGYYSNRMDGSIFSDIPWNGLSIASQEAPALIANARPGETYTAQPGTFFKSSADGAYVQANIKVSGGILRITSSYADERDDFVGDLDYTLLNAWSTLQNARSRTAVQDIDFVSDRLGRFDFTAGAFYMHWDETYDPSDIILYSDPPYIPTTTIFPETPPTPFYNQHSITGAIETPYAAYVEGGMYLFNDRLKLTAGGRYTHQTQRGFYNGGILNGPIVADNYSPSSWENFSPRLTARYALDDKNSVYATYSEGFKSGAFDTPTPTAPPVRPEILKSYEIGYKGSPVGPFYFELSGFYYNYSDVQVYSFNGDTSILQNGASAIIKGADFDSSLQITPAFNIRAGLEALDAKWRSFRNAQVYVPAANGYGLAEVGADLSGQRMYRSPPLTGNFNANYQLYTPLGEFGANASVYYSGRQKWDLNGLVTEGSYALIDAQLSYSPANVDNFRFVLWGTNLTDRAHLEGSIETAVAEAVSYEPPRQYGLRVEYRF